MANFLRGGTRLYAAPNRIIAHLDADDGALAPRTPEQTNRNDTYLTALLKLIPAEIVSVYMAIRDSAAQHKQLALWFFACLVACFILRAYASLPRTAARGVKDVQWTAVAVSCIAFVLWAHAIGDEPPVFPWLEAWLASALAALFGLLAPIVVPADRSAPEG